MSGDPNILWDKLCELFRDENDGPLPEMHLRDVPAGSAEPIWDRLLEGAKFAQADATVWLTGDDRDVAANDVDNLAGRAEANEISSMHIVLSNVSAEGVPLPDLGVSIYPGEVTIDYRVNEWSPATVSAFVSLLLELQALAPGSQVIAADEAGRPCDDAAQQALAWALDRKRLSRADDTPHS
ncbi:MAG: hypothetical protein JHC95_20835 [Solirubrobacteraceae bacterium]|nr:hypothetical protein [Solirubrobacteraceae bacterium]